MSTVKHVHLMGICGTAMGAFAGMLHALGYKISGSDANPYPPMSTQLEQLGITLFNGYQPDNLAPRPDLVIVGNVVRRDNPEAVAVEALGIPSLSMPAALSELFLKQNHSVVVAGTHGKTTTAALIAWALFHAGQEPGFMIGGELKNFNRNYRLGHPGFFVVEGDEYDTAYFDKGPKFLHYRPRSAIITSVEFDHADIYRDIDHVKSAFEKFIALLPSDGLLVACTDYEHLRALLPASPVEPVTYGLKGGCEYSGFVDEAGPTGMRFVLTRGGKPVVDFETPLVGKHNLLNLIATTLLLHRLGLSYETIGSALATFRGVRRRQEVFGDLGGITLVDDFAHHPTAVQVTIEAVRMRFPGRKLWAVFEPRSNSSRRRVFQDKYAGAFTGAHQVLIADVYNPSGLAEEDRFSPRELVESLSGRGVEARAVPSVDEIVEILARDCRPDDVILIMSNGGFGGIYKKLPAALMARGYVPRSERTIS